MKATALKESVDDPDAVLKGWCKYAALEVRKEIDRLTALDKRAALRDAPKVRQDKDPEAYLRVTKDKDEDKPGGGGSGRGGMGGLDGMSGMMGNDSEMEMSAGMDDYGDMVAGGMMEGMMTGMSGMGGATTAKVQPPRSSFHVAS